MSERILTKEEVDAIYTEHIRVLQDKLIEVILRDLARVEEQLEIIALSPNPPSTSPPSHIPDNP